MIRPEIQDLLDRADEISAEAAEVIHVDKLELWEVQMLYLFETVEYLYNWFMDFLYWAHYTPLNATYH